MISWFSRLTGGGFVRAVDATREQELLAHYSAFELLDVALWVEEENAVWYDAVDSCFGPEAASITPRDAEA